MNSLFMLWFLTPHLGERYLRHQFSRPVELEKRARIDFQNRLIFRMLFALSLALLLPTLVNAAPALRKAIQWQAIGDDLRISTVQLSGGLFSNEILFLQTKLQRYRLAVIRASDYGKTKASIKFLCERAKGVACINANFFDEQDKPLGLVVTRGIVYHPLHLGGTTLTGVLQVTRNGIEIVRRKEATPERALEAIQAGPRLVSDGLAITGLRNGGASSRRSGVCLGKDGALSFFILSAGLFGLSLDELQKLLVDKNIACKEALNLDGGGSSQFFLNSLIPGSPDRSQAIEIPGTDEIPIALGLFER